MSYRKDSECPLSTEITVTDTRVSSDDYPSNMGVGNPAGACDVYPFAVVLRLRVLQVVCGISAIVMGTVAFIEERGDLNLAMAVPAGCATVLAAAVSIHTSRGFGGYQPSTCGTSSSLRFLGPSARVAVPLAILWSVACSLHGALVYQVIRTLSTGTTSTSSSSKSSELSGTVIVLAVIEIILTVITITAVLVILRIDCKYDPD